MLLEGFGMTSHLEPLHLCAGTRQLTLEAGYPRLRDPQVLRDPHHSDWRF